MQAFDIVHGVVDPTGVDLYVGPENEIGTYFYELDQSTSPVFSNVKVLLRAIDSIDRQFYMLILFSS